ncbi:unnamed protein product, partial [Ectocarpus sp. 12 AP-2014]
ADGRERTSFVGVGDRVTFSTTDELKHEKLFLRSAQEVDTDVVNEGFGTLGAVVNEVRRLQGSPAPTPTGTLETPE